MRNIHEIELAIERALKQLEGNKNHLSLSDEEIIVAYRNTRLDNYTFTNYMTKLCKRSPMSIRAMLVLNDEYKTSKTLDIPR